MEKLLKKFDIFSASVPSFNIDGKTEVRTLTGGVISLSIVMLTILFGLLKLQHMLERKNPLISTNDVPSELSDEYDLDAEEFMMAFGLEDVNGKMLLHDPDYIKWVAGIWYWTEKEESAFYPLHPCTDQEFAKFYPA